MPAAQVPYGFLRRGTHRGVPKSLGVPTRILLPTTPRWAPFPLQLRLCASKHCRRRRHLGFWRLLPGLGFAYALSRRRLAVCGLRLARFRLLSGSCHPHRPQLLATSTLLTLCSLRYWVATVGRQLALTIAALLRRRKHFFARQNNGLRRKPAAEGLWSPVFAYSVLKVLAVRPGAVQESCANGRRNIAAHARTSSAAVSRRVGSSSKQRSKAFVVTLRNRIASRSASKAVLRPTSRS